jgi:hypothetical protein
MTTTRTWKALVNHYKWLLIYVAVVVTIGLVLQAWETTR